MPISSPNMNLPVPVPSVDSGPAWAQSEVACFSILDAHTHAPGSGVPITPTGLNINADLSFQTTSSATNLKSAVFTPSTVATRNTVYVSGVDLYYNDGNGNSIPITASGGVNAGDGSIGGLPSGTASAAYDAVSGTFVWQQSTSTAANMDAGTYVLRYPGSYPTPLGNYIALQAPSTLAVGWSLTFPTAAATTPNSFLVMATDGTLSYKYVDDSTLNYTGNSLQVKDAGITAIQIATDAVATGRIAAGVITNREVSGSASIVYSKLSLTNGILNADINSSAGILGSKIASSPAFNGKAATFASKNVVVSNTNATNGLAVIRGYVSNPNGTGFIGEGASITLNSTGNYTITFSSAFTDIPAFVATAVDTSGTLAAVTITIQSLSTSACTINTYSAGVKTSQAFTFVVMGQRT